MSGMDEEREKPREWTRREFLSASIKTGLGAAALATTASSSRIVRALTTPEADEFEYIVIGSGAGGGPLACNLARAGKHVLLIEAGGLDWNTNIETPAFHPKASEDPSVAWNYFVEHYSDPARQARDSKRVPGKGDTDEELAEFVKSEAWGHHASCSNKMGPASDPLAVVDSRFRVHGLQGLRIVDASVFPKIPGLFIAAPIYMIAEKAYEAILSRE